MKRAKLLRMLGEAGAVFVRHGKKHDVYRQPATNIETTIPRHDEIKEIGYALHAGDCQKKAISACFLTKSR
jgi:hypothetical protein